MDDSRSLRDFQQKQNMLFLQVAKITLTITNTIVGVWKAGTHRFYVEQPHPFSVNGCPYQIDIFPNWRNSMQIAILQMIRHALLSTHFNTIQSHLSRWCSDIVLVL